MFAQMAQTEACCHKLTCLLHANMSCLQTCHLVCVINTRKAKQNPRPWRCQCDKTHKTQNRIPSCKTELLNAYSRFSHNSEPHEPQVHATNSQIFGTIWNQFLKTPFPLTQQHLKIFLGHAWHVFKIFRSSAQHWSNRNVQNNKSRLQRWRFASVMICRRVPDQSDYNSRPHITPGLNRTQAGEIASIKTEINKSKMYKNSCYDN